MSGVIGSLDNYLEEVYKMGVKISNTVTGKCLLFLNINYKKGIPKVKGAIFK